CIRDRAHTREPGAELPSASAAQFGMIGSSPAMQHLLNEIAMVAPSDATVLIHGCLLVTSPSPRDVAFN
ncbi:hypothetical protein V3C21_25025, partial [Salmonella enterica subsp. enterica serovar Paratyphi B]